MVENPLTSPSLWNELHRDYEKTIAPLFSKVALRIIELVAPGEKSRVIDVACGPGTLTLNVAPRVRQVVAVDFASSMVGLLEQKCRIAAVRNVETRVADGMALPFAEAEFDAAFSSLGLFLFSDRAKGLNELFRVVKPQSKIGISSWTPAEGAIEAMYRIVREFLPNLPFQKGRAPLGSEGEITAELTAAGFQELHIEPVTVSFEFASVEEFWAENSRASGPLVAVRREIAAAQWGAVETRILEALRKTFPASVRYDRVAWVAVGRRPVT